MSSSRLGSALRGMGAALARTYRLGGRTFFVAPLFVALAVIPEFVQHIVEITLGMFRTAAGAHLVAQSPERWHFGYIKLFGFGLAILLIARFWAMGSVRETLRMPLGAVARATWAVALLVGSGFALEWLGRHSGSAMVDGAIGIFSWFVQMAILVWLVAVLAMDRTVTLRGALTERLPSALVTTVLLAAAFGPAQALHGLDHKLALGRPEAVVWALMTFDALVVGLMSALVGAALYVGYASGATWRGWRPIKEKGDPLAGAALS